ncbi:uncharacterized protein LY89DRAFT_758432, partial [Mollisia scopiformis]
TATYDHRLRKTGHPVRSAIHKSQIGRLVVGWVTTSEYLLLYVLFFLDKFCIILANFVGWRRKKLSDFGKGLAPPSTNDYVFESSMLVGSCGNILVTMGKEKHVAAICPNNL